MEPMEMEHPPSEMAPLTQTAAAALSAASSASTTAAAMMPTGVPVDTLSQRQPLSPAPAAVIDNAAPPIKRRAPIACRRCRRMRSKCVHQNAEPPCRACADAGLGHDECVFPVRGQPDHDRDYRHPRMRAEKGNKRDPAKIRRDILDAPIVSRPVAQPPSKLSVKGVDKWDQLPPVSDIIEGVRKFTTVYFQLGFIPKCAFIKRLEENPRSVSVFWLMSLLSIAARWTPSLVERFGKGNGVEAAHHFMERASNLALFEIYQEPTLERLQSFYLLSIAQQGSGHAHSSYINLGIAIRMASLLQLHREESYNMTNPTSEQIVQAESARRTLWMLHSQDNLHSGPRSPVSLAASDITALLPCSEEEFAHGIEPSARAALEDTPPARDNPDLCTGSRSLFASLMQVHHYWGIVSRRAMANDKSPCPWDSNSDYSKISLRLGNWEMNLPNDHKWSPYLLTGHKAAGQDLAYLGVTMVTRLCNIVLRRAYLAEMVFPEAAPPDQRSFFSKMALELFGNVHELYKQVDAQFRERQPDESVGAQMASFCVYSCALMTVYLQKFPKVCPDPNIVEVGPNMFNRTMSILEESKETWPLASRWLEGLRKFSGDARAGIATEGTMADGDPALSAFGNINDPAREKRSILQVPPAPPQPGLDHQVGDSFSEPIRTVPSPAQHGTLPQGHAPNGHSHSLDQTQAAADQIANIAGHGRGQNHDALGLLIEAMGPNAQQSYTQGPQNSMMPDSFCVPMPGSSAPSMQITPANDGYDAELSMYSSWNHVEPHVQHQLQHHAQPNPPPGAIYTGY